MILFLGSLEYVVRIVWHTPHFFNIFPIFFLQNKLIRLAWTYNQFCADLPDNTVGLKQDYMICKQNRMITIWDKNTNIFCRKTRL